MDGVTQPKHVDRPRIVRPERVPVRAVWPFEPTHFTPWLGEHLQFLDDIGLGTLTSLNTGNLGP